jgi:hypothetical protein
MVMIKSWITVALLLGLHVGIVLGQIKAPEISEMRWGSDFNLHIRLSNDTNYVMDVRALHHAARVITDTAQQTTTYYPVNLDEEFIGYLKQRKLQTEATQSPLDTAKRTAPTTLWSALHKSVGGGYVHFINCVMYSLESQQLNLSDAIMSRPVTNWKPKPMTATYKRTQKWQHYIPFDQKLAQKEYKLRAKENDLRDLQGIPQHFIDRFLATSQKQYDAMLLEGKRHFLAQINLVRLLLGAKYLGVSQINYIRGKVENALALYSLNNLPSVIIFDDYNAAVAMSLDKMGYRIDYVVFRDQERLTPSDQKIRIEKIESLVEAVNEANENVFRKRLSNYYGR